MNTALRTALSALLAALPAAVVSLSVGARLEEDDNRAGLSFGLEALVRVNGVDTDWRDLLDSDEPEAWTSLYDLQDDLRTVVSPFSHLLPVDELATVTR